MIDREQFSASLRLMLAKATGRPCGLGSLPLVDGSPAPVPYIVLYPQGGRVHGAPLADRSEDADLVYQVTSVGARTDQAEWMAGRVERAVLERTAVGGWRYPLVVPGADVWAREQDADDGTDDSGADDGVVTSSQRYRFKASSTR
ncbi:hypothetical protein [Streptomyces sp. NPDC090026]|uniref:hypothetical protein n=1 Tax=Streptomyces sp. NPDC090026 TaxID=3365923 RepID=UPI00382AF6EF